MLLKKIIYLVIFLLVFILSIRANNIHQAAQKGDIEQIKTILKKMPELLETKDDMGRTPLHWAARGVHFEVMKYLLEKSAEVNSGDSNGITALHSLASRGHLEGVKLLVKHKADVNQKTLYGNTPLNYAISGGHNQVVNLLVENGAKVPVIGQKARIMLHDAAKNGCRELVEIMIKKGVDIRTLNGNGGTLLHSASKGGLDNLIDKLIPQGFGVNKKNRYGKTPLHFAAAHGRKTSVELLLNRGAEINITTFTGKRPIHFAEESGCKRVVDILKLKGALQDPQRFPVLAGKYLGQKGPGKRPVLFAPGIVSTEHWDHGAPWFSSDGKEVYFSYVESDNDSRGAILFMAYENDRWTEPRIAPFSSITNRDVNPALSPDGRKLYFVSCRPLSSNESNGGYNIWFVKRKSGGWSVPTPLGPILQKGCEAGWSVSKFGNLYFLIWQQEKRGQFVVDVCRTKLVNDGFENPMKLGEEVNSRYHEADPFIAPDESYLIYAVDDMPGGYGAFDLYISFRKKDGSWTQSKNMGKEINTPAVEEFPAVTPDGQFLFFVSNRNGNHDIYWMDAKIINELR